MSTVTAILSDVELETLGREIAATMGGDWSCRLDKDRETDRVWGIILANGKGEAFEIRRDWREKGKLNVHGVYPRGGKGGKGTATTGECWGQNVKRYQEHLPTIQVSASRKPSAIAADIARRFLPGYLEVLARAIAAKAQAETSHDAREATLARLLAACPSLRRSNQPNSQECYFAGETSGSVKVGHDADVSITLNYIPADLAEKILAIVGGAE